MRSEEILDALAELDARFATHRWKVGALHALPIFRYEFYNGNHDLHLRSGLVISSETRPQRLARGVKQSLRAASRYLEKRRDEQVEPRRGQLDAVLYSDGISFVRLDGRIYDRFCDPVAAALGARGATSLIVTPLHEEAGPRHSPTLFVQHSLDAARVVAFAESRVALPPAELDDYEAACSVLRARCPTAYIPDARRLRRAGVHIEAYTRVFDRLLRRALPKVVYLVCYYGAERWGMLVAARRLGIPTVDIQHGYSGDLHWGYARWQRVPAGGYDLLPRWFWVWGPEEQKTLSAWTRACPDAHGGLVGGNLFSHMWKRGGDPIVDASDAQVKGLLSRHPGRRAVLYAANGLETDAQLTALAAALRASSSEFYWYFRMHPCFRFDEARVRGVFGAEAATYVDVEHASELPLYALLRHVDAHVTESSTTIIEATEFGVPTVLCGRTEERAFAAYVESGWARACDGPADLPGAVSAALAREAPSRGSAPPSAGASDLDDLLGLASSRPVRSHRREASE